MDVFTVCSWVQIVLGDTLVMPVIPMGPEMESFRENEKCSCLIGCDLAGGDSRWRENILKETA
jgi:hypothetical protein